MFLPLALIDATGTFVSGIVSWMYQYISLSVSQGAALGLVCAVTIVSLEAIDVIRNWHIWRHGRTYRLQDFIGSAVWQPVYMWLA